MKIKGIKDKVTSTGKHIGTHVLGHAVIHSSTVLGADIGLLHGDDEHHPVDNIPEKEDVAPAPLAETVEEDMTFSEAFASAREELGSGGVFVWNNNAYSTYNKEEWEALTPEELAEYRDSLNAAEAEHEELQGLDNDYGNEEIAEVDTAETENSSQASGEAEVQPSATTEEAPSVAVESPVVENIEPPLADVEVEPVGSDNTYQVDVEANTIPEEEPTGEPTYEVEYDTNSDGEVDFTAIHNEEGALEGVELNQVDLDMEANAVLGDDPDIVDIDIDNDGQVDAVGLDLDQDGKIDYVVSNDMSLQDLDGDGVFESIESTSEPESTEVEPETPTDDEDTPDDTNEYYDEDFGDDYDNDADVSDMH